MRRWQAQVLTTMTGEGGDVPGWVLIVLMTSALVVMIWGIASPKLANIVKSALETVCDGIGC